MLDEHILRPQTVGDVVGRAIRVYRTNIRRWAPLLIWPTAIVALGRAAMQGGAFLMTQTATDQSKIMLALLLLGGLVISYLGFWFILIRLLVFVRLANGFSEDMPEAIEFIKQKQWTILGVLLLGGCLFICICILWGVELVAASILYRIVASLSVGALIFGFIGIIVSTSFIIYALLLSLCAIACEGGGVASMLSRGFSMGSKTFFRTMFCGILSALTLNLITTPLWIPLLIVIGIDALRIGAEASMSLNQPFYWQVMYVLWRSLIEMITWPVLFVTFGFYYYDLRLRFEGVDVLVQLDQLKLKNLE